MGIPAFAGRGYPYSTLAGQRAFCLTDAAADAPFIDHIGLFDPHLIAGAVQDFGLTKLDCLFRCRAVLFTDDAGYTFGVRQAAVLIKEDIADLCGMFLFQGKFCKSPGWAHLAAESAVVFTIP